MKQNDKSDWEYLEFQEGVLSGSINREFLALNWRIMYDQIKQEDIKRQIQELSKLTTNTISNEEEK